MQYYSVALYFLLYVRLQMQFKSVNQWARALENVCRASLHFHCIFICSFASFWWSTWFSDFSVISHIFRKLCLPQYENRIYSFLQLVIHIKHFTCCEMLIGIIQIQWNKPNLFFFYFLLKKQTREKSLRLNFQFAFPFTRNGGTDSDIQRNQQKVKYLHIKTTHIWRWNNTTFDCLFIFIFFSCLVSNKDGRE